MIELNLRRRLAAVAGIAFAALAAGCGDGSGGSGSGGTISVELAGDPVVQYDAAKGLTTVEIQFTARGMDGVPLAPGEFAVDMLIDGSSVSQNPLNESVFVEGSEELGASLLYGLVLDASYSMTQQKPEAFGPMKVAARTSVEDGVAAWSGRPSGSVFAWDLCWFNGFLFAPSGTWLPAHIEAIPPPDPSVPEERFTKLYAAVEYMAKRMLDAYNAGQAAGPRDHHVMVVLSDGVDNRSNFDNSGLQPQVHDITAQQVMASYRQFGWEGTDLQKAIAAIQSHPRLTVHALALGTDFGPQDKGVTDLKSIAAAGHGQFLRNPSSAGIAALFDRVTKEFSTLQMRRLSIAQNDGDHTFRLIVRPTPGLGEAFQEFRYRSGPDAQLLSRSAAQ
jgi:hypothetical protein